MKINIIYLIALFVLNSCSNKFTNAKYTYIDPHKEQDLQLVMYPDSTFILKDIYGCNRMIQKGNWSLLDMDRESKYLKIALSDTINVVKYTNIHDKVYYSFISNVDKIKYVIKEEQYFPLITKDTISIVKNDEILFLRGLTFKKSNKNIEKERIKMLEKEIINRIGKKIYISTIGEGISLKKARENLAYCNEIN